MRVVLVCKNLRIALAFAFLFIVLINMQSKLIITRFSREVILEEIDAYRQMYKGIHEINENEYSFKLVAVEERYERFATKRLARLDQSEIGQLFSFLYSHETVLIEL
jgi:hypothetical protein